MKRKKKKVDRRNSNTVENARGRGRQNREVGNTKDIGQIGLDLQHESSPRTRNSPRSEAASREDMGRRRDEKAAASHSRPLRRGVKHVWSGIAKRFVQQLRRPDGGVGCVSRPATASGDGMEHLLSETTE